MLQVMPSSIEISITCNDFLNFEEKCFFIQEGLLATKVLKIW